MSTRFSDRRPEEVLAELRAWDFGGQSAALVARLTERTGWTSSYAQSVVNELWRYLVLLACGDPNGTVPSPDVEKAWHEALADTELYQVTCRDFLGGMLHYEPVSSDQEMTQRRAIYVDTLLRYYEGFGQKPPADIWPPARDSTWF